MKRQNEAQQLLQRRAQEASKLPPFSEIVRGSLLTRCRRCGKANCHCAKTKGHGPAHYLVVTLKPGKTQQILLSEEMLPAAQRMVDNYGRWWNALEKVSAVNRQLLRLRAEELGGSKKTGGRKPGASKAQAETRGSGK